MLITLPLVPVFMWLIGRYTEERTPGALGGATAPVEPLPRRRTRAADAAGVQPQHGAERRRSREVSERYRQATMGTLRVGFLSGSVLELAATLGVALVAVTVGVRLVDGRLGLQAGLTVCCSRPSCICRCASSARSSTRARTGSRSRSACWRCSMTPCRRRRGERRPFRRAPARHGRLEGVSFAYPSRPGLVLDGLDLTLLPGRDRRARRRERSREEHRRKPAPRLRRAACRSNHRRRRRSRGVRPRRVAAAARLGAAATDDLPRHGRGQHPARRRGASRTSACERRHGSPAPTRSCARFREGYETVVGDGGRPLSAGERRRIALARAFLRDAPLVVLDEPTADLDPESAAVVADAVERLRGGGTCC